MSEPKKYAVVVSDRAKRMLGAHVRFIARVDKAAAQETKKRLMAALRSLSQMPQRFPFLQEEYITPNQYRKMYVEKWYLVLYQVREDTVYVDYILDCRQDYGWLLS